MKKRSLYILSFTIPILTMALVFCCLQFYPLSDKTITSGDFTAQYLPLYVALKNAILNFDLSQFYWSFSKGLGGATPSVLGFNSISPLTLLYAIFPVSQYSILTVIVTLLRHGLCGLTFSYYLVKCKNGNQDTQSSIFTLIFSSIYALSGFIISQQINPNFLDNLVYLPLLAIGIERILNGKFNIKFSIVLAIMYLTQFYTAYMATLFIVFYGLYYLLSLNLTWKQRLLRYSSLAIASFLGIFLCGFWVFPLLSNLIESKASADSIFAVNFDVLYQPFLIFTKFFVGAFSGEEWGDSAARPQIYIAVIGLLGLCHYFLSTKISLREKYSALVLLGIFLASFTIHFFDQIWHMGQRPVGFYFRNSWIFIFIALTLGYTAFQQQNHIKKQDIPKHLLVLLGICIVGFTAKVDYLNSTKIFISVLLFEFTIMILSTTKKQRLTLVLFLTVGELFINAFLGLPSALWFISNDNFTQVSDTYSNTALDTLQDSSPFYRVESYKPPIYANYNYYSRTNSVTHFSSSLEFNQIELYSKLGLPSSTAMTNYVSLPLTDALFNLKYFIDSNEHHAQTLDLEQRYMRLSKYDKWQSIFYNPYTLNLGFLADETFTAYEMNEHDPFFNQNELMKRLFQIDDNLFEQEHFSSIQMENLAENNGQYTRIDENQPTKLSFQLSNANSDYLYFLRVPSAVRYEFTQSQLTQNDKPYLYQDRFKRDQIWPLHIADNQTITFTIDGTKPNFYALQDFKLYRFDLARFKALITAKQADNIEILSAKHNKIKANVTVNNEHMSTAFFSIPYSRGWHVKANGQTIATKAAWGSFLSFKLPVGEQHLDLYYRPPGLILGCLASILSAAILLAIHYHNRLRKKRFIER
ncbi:YfhO family protein [Aerococcaceae bacterium zg-ZUI334]|uniref:YfhO family protein n=1 Tax=Aerococcaceae bacterium zg-252 TaxID=2796928 RepID=UPI001BA43035|nr:YfhO family protein [Aerococcaceae bacterium zg-ZUI334]